MALPLTSLGILLYKPHGNWPWRGIFCQLYGDQASFFEAGKAPRIKHKKKGTLSVVNKGSDQHGSQFLITTGENLDYPDGVHTLFGEVTEGMDVLKTINEIFVDKDFIPYQDIRIKHTVILHDPFDDPHPHIEQLNSGRTGADEEIDDMKGQSTDETEVQTEKATKTCVILLEMVGDLREADIKPPENVLFFEKEEDCEKACLKMGNVLVDDRWIHVDFSQLNGREKVDGRKSTKEDFKEHEKERDKASKFTLKRKYNLVLDEDVEESHTSQLHLAKKQKKNHHHSEDDDKRTKTSKDSDQKHEECCRESTKGFVEINTFYQGEPRAVPGHRQGKQKL
ncbi:hypothetical protein EK904_002803 [Melospiza melodia maxima]|nr:hypothetical protein EK904_002803 [Melospiza melodia maxima]